MSHTVHPRRFLKATYDVKEAWSRALIDEFGPGGLIAEQAPKFQREHLLWALVQLRHVNGRDGMTYIGDMKISEGLGYNTKDLPGKQTRDTLTALGFFTQQGTNGRAARLRLSHPVALEGRYPSLDDSTVGDVVTVADTKPSKPRTPKNEMGDFKAAAHSELKEKPLDPQPASAEGDDAPCPVHSGAECPDASDPFGDASPWELMDCVRRRAA
ncbi:MULTISPECIES: hypothetical protein [unclassified Streptomyces]|uniref:hypothetical protein n=1 Tax=unclassified Streptomyces TaxID=2593676 RepID=UPI003809DAE9